MEGESKGLALAPRARRQDQGWLGKRASRLGCMWRWRQSVEPNQMSTHLVA